MPQRNIPHGTHINWNEIRFYISSLCCVKFSFSHKRHFYCSILYFSIECIHNVLSWTYLFNEWAISNGTGKFIVKSAVAYTHTQDAISNEAIWNVSFQVCVICIDVKIYVCECVWCIWIINIWRKHAKTSFK